MEVGHVELRILRILFRTGRLILAEDNSSLMRQSLVLSRLAPYLEDSRLFVSRMAAVALCIVSRSALQTSHLSKRTEDLEENMLCLPGSMVKYLSFILKGQKSVQRQSRRSLPRFHLPR